MHAEEVWPDRNRGKVANNVQINKEIKLFSIIKVADLFILLQFSFSNLFKIWREPQEIYITITKN